MMSIDQVAASGWPGHARGSAAYGRLLAALFCAGVATFAQLYSPQAVLPLIAADLGTGAASAALMVSASTVGLAIGVIPWSTLADRIGRVNAISISVTGATTVGLLVPFAPAFQLLLAGRFLEGLIVGGVPAIAVAYLTEEIDPVHATRAAGTFVAGTTIGGLTGRLVSSPVAEIAGWRIGVFTVAVVCGIAALSFVKLAPQPRGFVPSIRSGTNPEGSLGQRLFANLRSRRQLTLFAQAFLLMGGFVALYNYLGFRLSAAPFLPPTLRRQPRVPGISRRDLGIVSRRRGGVAVRAEGGPGGVRCGDDRRRRYYLERQRHRGSRRPGDRHRRVFWSPLDRGRMDRSVGAGGQSAGVVAVQPLLLRRFERHRLVRRTGVRRVRLDRCRGDDHGAGRHRGRRGNTLPAC
jgi:hypothetical protein